MRGGHLQQKIKKNREKNVARYKVLRKYKAVRKDLSLAESPQLQRWQQEAADAAAEEHQRAPGGEGGEDVPARTKKQKKTAPNALLNARREWEKSHEVELAERAEARRQAEERQRQRDEAAQRRKEKSARLQKRTKSGQPVLSNQVEALLSRIQKKS